EVSKKGIGLTTLNKIKNGNYLLVTVISGIEVENFDLTLQEGSCLISSISMAGLENAFRTAVTKLR
ncbi:thiamine phosphate synthase, partial [Leptospira interrogans serovar Pomona]|nr:thiamine phosphate synthase [Leptospira interrogans serovar Pomona]